MGRWNKNSSVLDGIKAFGLTYGMTRGVMQDSAMADIADAKPETNASYTEAKGEEINAIANAKDENGKPYYDVAGNDKGGYTVSTVPVEGQAVQSGEVNPTTRTTFLGKTVDGTMSETDQNRARLIAQAGVRSRFGDPESAQRLRLQGMQIQGAEQKLADDAELRGALSSGKVGQTIQRSEALRSDTAGASAAQGSEPSLDAYLRTSAPQAVKTLLKQGRIDEAKQFSEFIDSEKGRSYATKWLNGVRKHAIGDSAGALAHFEAMYNDQSYDDGLTVKITELEGGKKYQIDHISADGKVLGSQTGDTASLANQAANALSPMSAVKFHAEQQAARVRENGVLDRQLQLEWLRQQGKEVQEDRRDDRLAMRLDARAAGGSLTLPQQRSNSEIDAAREAVAGMDPAEIRRLTAKTTNTGRENPDFRPELDRAVRLAGRRKVGSDDLFDQRQGGQMAEAPAIDRSDVAKRFRSERAMDGYTLGKETPSGIEVMQKGRVVGHYR